MRCLILISLSLMSFISFAQQRTDTVGIHTNDTTDITTEIRSSNYFYFCSKVYKILRDCDGQDQSNCCYYTAHIFKGELTPRSGQFGCYNGTSLFWNYFDSEEIAKFNLDNTASQRERQMKKFNKTEVTCFLGNQKVNGYRMNFETMEGIKGYSINAYGIINGQSVLVELRSQKEINSDDDIKPFAEIFRLK